MSPIVDRQRQVDADEAYNAMRHHLDELWHLAGETHTRRHLRGLVENMNIWITGGFGSDDVSAPERGSP